MASVGPRTLRVAEGARALDSEFECRKALDRHLCEEPAKACRAEESVPFGGRLYGFTESCKKLLRAVRPRLVARNPSEVKLPRRRLKSWNRTAVRCFPTMQNEDNRKQTSR